MSGVTDPPSPAALPADFVRTTHDLFGARGEAWLAALPALLGELSERWGLTVGPPFAPLTYNYVAPAVRADGTRAVLKLGVPSKAVLREEAALRRLGIGGIVPLLAADAARGALLLERLEPGTPLSRLFKAGRDEEATRIAAGVMRRLWRPAPADSPALDQTVADWAAGLGKLRARFDGGTGPFPKLLTERAEALFRGLLSAPAEPALLHGDLHHDNILAVGGDDWIAIDPKGVIGDPAYEVGALLRNPCANLLDAPDLDRLLARRVDVLAEMLGFTRERIAGWGIAQAVLAAWWTLEDHGRGWERDIALAEKLSAIRV